MVTTAGLCVIRCVRSGRAVGRFTLPQICGCGARGAITFEPAGPPVPGEQDPDPAIVAAGGAFDLDGDGGILCLACGQRVGRHNGQPGTEGATAVNGQAVAHVIMLDLSCHCGRVEVTIERRPDYINQCNCTLCRKTGARWAYFQPSLVRVHGGTKSYRRRDKDGPGAEIHFCPDCGTTTHFNMTAEAVAKFGQDLVGVNMRLADDSDLAGLELRYPDGYSWSGAGEFSYVRAPRIICQGSASG